MPITGQYDVLFMPWMTQYLTLGSPNIYENLNQEFGSIILKEPAVWAPYPYGFYALTSLWTSAIEWFNGEVFANWDWAWGVPFPERQVFYFKLIYLLFDCLILYTLYSKVGKIAGILWAWSPLALYTPFMMGQNDIYATACTIVAVWAMAHYSHQKLSAPEQNGMNHWALASSFLLGIGAAFKIYPLLLLIPLLLTVTLSWKDRIVYTAVGIGTFLSVVIPFLSTSAFVDGVLFNPEGSQLFRQVNILGIALPMFLLSYGALLIVLLFTQQPKQYAAAPWFVALMMFALLFIWVPTPLYWLIWITPIVCATVYFVKEMWLTWGLLQTGFILSSTGLHRELGVALPIHLNESFNIPNMPTALTLKYPAIAAIYIAIQPLFSGMIVASMVLMLALASRKIWFTTRGEEPITDILPETKIKGYVSLCLVPALAMFVLLALNLYVGRDMVAKNSWLEWKPYQINTSTPLFQEVSGEGKVIHGIRIKIVDATEESEISVCIFGDGLAQTELLQCATASTSQLVEDRQLYLFFNKPVVAEKDSSLTIRVETKGLTSATANSGQVNILVGLDQNAGKILMESKVTQGTANLSMLTEFNFRAVVNEWLIGNVIRDKQLPIAISTVFICVLGFIFALVAYPNSQLNS